MQTNSRKSSVGFPARDNFSDSDALKGPRAKRRLSALHGRNDQRELIDAGRELSLDASHSTERQFLTSTSYGSPRSTPKHFLRQESVYTIKRRSKRKKGTKEKDNRTLSGKIKKRRRASGSPNTNGPRAYEPNSIDSNSSILQNTIIPTPSLLSPRFSPLVETSKPLTYPLSPSSSLTPKPPQSECSNAKYISILENQLRAQGTAVYRLRATIQSVQKRLFSLEIELDRLHGLELSVARLEVLEKDIAALKQRKE
ncbi:MAG: hypothetical protein Q9160_002142 [Pyrenula sp. 1 TL-2023]